MRNTLILGTAMALMATTALAAAPAGLNFPFDPTANEDERTRAPAGLVLAADDDEGDGLLYRLGLRGDGGLLSGPSGDDDDEEDEEEDEDEEDEEEDEDEEDGDDDEGDDDEGDDGDNDGNDGNDGNDDGGDDD